MSMVHPLDQLTAETFETQLGSKFDVCLDEGQPPVTTLTLVEVTSLKQGPDAKRVPFSLLFDCPAVPALDQGTFWLKNETLGDLTIFIVPISGDSQTRRYQAIFS